MLKRIIEGYSEIPRAPRGWANNNEGACYGLPVRVTRDDQGRVLFCESAWETTPEELDFLNAGGQVVLRVAGWQVPVALYVEPPSDTSKSTPNFLRILDTQTVKRSITPVEHENALSMSQNARNEIAGIRGKTIQSLSVDAERTRIEFLDGVVIVIKEGKVIRVS